MPNRPKPLFINLLPQDPFYETTIGKILLWASNIGRYLVIFTELLVIISFGTRFKLDRDLTDLNTLITQKSAIIDSYGSLEEDVRLIQKKTAFIAEKQTTLSPTESLAMIAQRIPKNIVLTTMQTQGQQMQIIGLAYSSKEFAQFIQSLQTSPTVKGITVDQVKTSEKGTAGFEFTLRLTVGKSGVKTASTQ